jgi:hypothetical protein
MCKVVHDHSTIAILEDYIMHVEPCHLVFYFSDIPELWDFSYLIQGYKQTYTVTTLKIFIDNKHIIISTMLQSLYWTQYCTFKLKQ